MPPRSSNSPGGAKRERNREDALELLEPYMPPSLSLLLRDDAISEVQVNGPRHVFIERGGRLEQVEVPGLRDQAIRTVALHVARRQNMEFGPSDPILECRLPDGSRLSATCPPVTPFVALTIRRFPARRFTWEQLIRIGSLHPLIAERVAAAFAAGANTVVSGGTGSGKTTFLSALLSEADAGERIVSVEDTAEIDIPHLNHLPMETRHGSKYSIRDLVRAALRQSPDRLVVGEVRGGEAYDLLQALNTGHGGSVTTVHANTAMDALVRLGTLAMQAEGVRIDFETACQMVAGGVGQVVQLTAPPAGRQARGQRRAEGAALPERLGIRGRVAGSGAEW